MSDKRKSFREWKGKEGGLPFSKRPKMASQRPLNRIEIETPDLEQASTSAHRHMTQSTGHWSYLQAQTSFVQGCIWCNLTNIWRFEQRRTAYSLHWGVHSKQQRKLQFDRLVNGPEIDLQWQACPWHCNIYRCSKVIQKGRGESKHQSGWTNVWCRYRWLEVNKNFKDLKVCETWNAFFSKRLFSIIANWLLQNGRMNQVEFLHVASQLYFTWNYVRNFRSNFNIFL